MESSSKQVLRRDPESWDDEMREACGIFGIFAPEEKEIARIITLALVTLQHRGQEACGISTVTADRQMNTEKGMGLVTNVFSQEERIKPLKGIAGIGHCRYATSGCKSLENVQPMAIETKWGRVCIAHNGTLTTCKKLRRELLEKGIALFKDGDIEVIAQYLAHNVAEEAGGSGPNWEARIAQFMNACEGTYSLAFLTNDAIYGCRDIIGNRPLTIGELQYSVEEQDPVNGGMKKRSVTRYVLASESSALVMIGARYVREVVPGEIVRIDKNGLHSTIGKAPPKPAFCIFEYVYFARPDAIMEGQLVHRVRQRLGAQLAREAPADCDVVIGVPDSSLAAAIGFAEHSGIPYTEGLLKNRYIHRTFIQPTQELRKKGVTYKFAPLPQNIRGKRVALIDDSIVRGNTIQGLIKLLRNAGATAIHVRITSPPIRHPCFMGIDIPDSKLLIAREDRSEEHIRQIIGSDSLRYLSQAGMEAAVRGDQAGGYCGACFNGKYPIEIDEW